jgi:hypothetical protein
MMRADPRLRVFTALAWLMAGGCTSLRELPRESYAAQTERKHVAVTTKDGQQQEFEYAHFGPDTLIGYKHLDVEGAAEEYTAVPVPLDEVVKLSARRIDWYRTGLVGGAAIAIVVAAGLSLRKQPTPAPPPPVVPCPEEPCPP